MVSEWHSGSRLYSRHEVADSHLKEVSTSCLSDCLGDRVPVRLNELASPSSRVKSYPERDSMLQLRTQGLADVSTAICEGMGPIISEFTL
jgi:hypothetical protein